MTSQMTRRAAAWALTSRMLHFRQPAHIASERAGGVSPPLGDELQTHHTGSGC